KVWAILDNCSTHPTPCFNKIWNRHGNQALPRGAALGSPLRTIPRVSDGRPHGFLRQNLVKPYAVRPVIVPLHRDGHLHAPIPIVPNLAVIGISILTNHVALTINPIGPGRRRDCSSGVRNSWNECSDLVRSARDLPARGRCGHGV